MWLTYPKETKDTDFIKIIIWEYHKYFLILLSYINIL